VVFSHLSTIEARTGPELKGENMIDGLHRAYRDVTHCLIAIRELRHLFGHSRFTDPEDLPVSKRRQWLSHFVDALDRAYKSASESVGLLQAEFAKARGSDAELCGVSADSLHAVVVKLGALVLERMQESWDGNRERGDLPAETMYQLAIAFHFIDPAALWIHTEIEQEYSAARKGRPPGRGPRTRRELAADLSSIVRSARDTDVPGKCRAWDEYDEYDAVPEDPLPVYHECRSGAPRIEWLYRAFDKFRDAGCGTTKDAAQRFNSASERLQRVRQEAEILRSFPDGCRPPNGENETYTAERSALFDFCEAFLEAVRSSNQDMETPLEMTGCARAPDFESDRREEGTRAQRRQSCIRSWGIELLPKAPDNDLFQAHRDVAYLAYVLQTLGSLGNHYVSDSCEEDSLAVDRRIADLEGAYWRAKYRMAIVGKEFADCWAGQGPVRTWSYAADAVEAESAHAVVVKVVEMLLERIQQAIDNSSNPDHVGYDNYYSVCEVFRWRELSYCSHWDTKGHPCLEAEYEEAEQRRAGAEGRREANSGEGADTPDSKMSKEDANVKALELAKANPEFVHKSQREWAKLIGCSFGTISKTKLWQETMKQSGRGRKNRDEQAPKAVSLTPKVLSTQGEHDEELTRLIDEQKADAGADKIFKQV
jgi:hypothetical protein